MKGHKPSQLVPRLRFLEFRRAGNWKSDQIGNVANITKGKGISKADITKSGVTPCIRYAELYTNYGEVIHKVVSCTNVPIEKLMLSRAADIIIPASGETKEEIARAACVLPEGVALGSDLNILRSDLLYGPFFSYLLNSPIRYTIAGMAQGDSIAHLYPNQLSHVLLTFPNRIEQQKIADCLDSLDDLIVVAKQKLEALRQHKQGLIQQLFPQPSETVPRLRFPEFRNSNVWPIKPLGEIFDEINETGFPELPLLSLTGLYGVILQEDLNRRNTANLNKGKYLRVIPGDIVYNTMRMWEGRSARTSLEGLVSPAYTVCRPKIETDSFFFAYYFKTSAMIEQFRKYSQGLVKDTLSLKYHTFSQISAAFPSLNEQQKIASSLSSLDDLIAAAEQKLEALREHKKGLMQQLFPSLVKI